MTDLSAAIEQHRTILRSCIRAGQTDRAWLALTTVLGLRICAGEITVRLKPPIKI